MQLSWVLHPLPPGSFDLSILQKTRFLEVLETCCVLCKVKPWTWMSWVFLILLSIGISFSIEFQVDFTTLKRWRNFSVVLWLPLCSLRNLPEAVLISFFVYFLSLWKHSGSSLPSPFVSFAVYFSVYTLYLFRLEIHSLQIRKLSPLWTLFL